jgi:hypothetical protein
MIRSAKGGAYARITHGSGATTGRSSAAEQRKAEREIETFRRYRQLERSFVEINEKICHARPVEDTLTPEEKKRRTRSSPRSRAK